MIGLKILNSFHEIMDFSPLLYHKTKLLPFRLKKKKNLKEKIQRKFDNFMKWTVSVTSSGLFSVNSQ